MARWVGAVALGVCALLGSGCGASESAADAGAVPTGGGGGGLQLTGGRVARALHAANAGLLAEAQLAQKRASMPGAAQVAEQIASGCSAANARLDELARRPGFAYADSAIATELATQAAEVVAALAQLQAGAFDPVFLTSQKLSHEQVLGLIDDELLPNTTDPALLKEIQAERSLLAAQLGSVEKLALAPDGPDAGLAKPDASLPRHTVAPRAAAPSPIAPAERPSGGNPLRGMEPEK